MTKITIKENMDLLKIYNEGKFEEFKNSLNVYNKDLLERAKLLCYFRDTYFPEIRIIQNNNMIEFHKKYNYKSNDELKFEEVNENKLAEKRLTIYEDDKFKELEKILKKTKGVKIKPDARVLDELVQLKIEDKIGIEFYLKYLNKRSHRFTYITLLEEAIEAKADDVVEFINENPLPKHVYIKNIMKRNKEIFKNYRNSLNLTVDEFARKTEIDENLIKSLEYGNSIPSINEINEYSKLLNKNIDEVLNELHLEERKCKHSDETYLTIK